MRRNKSRKQQEKCYDVVFFYDYMADVFLNGNIGSFVSLYRELCREAKEEFIDYLAWELHNGNIHAEKVSLMLRKCLVK